MTSANNVHDNIDCELYLKRCILRGGHNLYSLSTASWTTIMYWNKINKWTDEFNSFPRFHPPCMTLSGGTYIHVYMLCSCTISITSKYAYRMFERNALFFPLVDEQRQPVQMATDMVCRWLDSNAAHIAGLRYGAVCRFLHQRVQEDARLPHKVYLHGFTYR